MLLALTCIAACAPWAQQQSGHAVPVTVRGEDGTPIAHATVRITPVWPRRYPELAAWLPRGESDAAGRCTLTLAAAQLATDTDDPRIVLQVEREGHQPWCEALPSPLGLYAGSDVVLRPLRDGDRARIRVEQPEPGMIVLVEPGAVGATWWAGPAVAPEPLAVPASGELIVHAPLLPSPLAIPRDQHGCLPLGWQVRLVYPGRSSPPVAIAAGALVTFAKPQVPCPARRVRRADGMPLSNLRVLLECGGGCRWFDLPGDEVPVDPVAEPQVVLAEGCSPGVWRREQAEVVLQTASTRTELHFVDRVGKPIESARVTWTPYVTRPFGSWLNLGEHWLIEGNTVQLGGRLERGCGMLGLATPAGDWWLCWDPWAAGLPDPVVMDAPLRGTVALVDEAGRPLANAQVLSHSGGPDGMPGFVTSAPDGLPVITNAAGEVTIEEGFLIARAFGHSFPTNAPIERGKVQRVVGRRLVPITVRSLDDAGRPIPFVNFGWPGRDDYTPWSWHMTDSRGMATVFVAGDSQAIAVERAGQPAASAIVARADRANVLDAASMPLVLVRTPVADASTALCAANRGEANATIVSTTPLAGSEAMLLRWDPDLEFWLQSVHVGPPVLVRRADLQPLEGGVLTVDHRPITRRIPLRLTGDVPKDLAALRAQPRRQFGRELTQVPGNHVELDGQGAAWLTVRDDAEHDVWLLHPDLLPLRTTVPAADGAREVVAQLQRGAPLTIRCMLNPSLEGSDILFLTVRRGLEILGHGEIEIRAARQRAKRYDIVSLRAPFALPAGQCTARVTGPCLYGSDVELQVTGTEPVVLDLGR